MWVLKEDEFVKNGPIYYVGHYNSAGQFEVLESHDRLATAKLSVGQLNGGAPSLWQDEIKEIVADICDTVSRIKDLLEEYRK